MASELWAASYSHPKPEAADVPLLGLTKLLWLPAPLTFQSPGCLSELQLRPVLRASRWAVAAVQYHLPAGTSFKLGQDSVAMGSFVLQSLRL